MMNMQCKTLEPSWTILDHLGVSSWILFEKDADLTDLAAGPAGIAGIATSTACATDAFAPAPAAFAVPSAAFPELLPGELFCLKDR